MPADGRIRQRLIEQLQDAPPIVARDLDEAVRTLTRAGLRLTVAAVAVQTVAHTVNRVAFDLEYGFFDAGADLSFFAFCSATATVLCGTAALLLAAVSPERRRLLVPLACGLGALAVDDMFAVHERLAARLDAAVAGVEDAGRVLWPLVLLPLLAACFLALWILSMTLRQRARRLARGGLALLVLAVALEMLSFVLVNVGQDEADALYQIAMLAEEGAELGGWLLIATALATAVLRACSPSP